jgi:hypothetical protein
MAKHAATAAGLAIVCGLFWLVVVVEPDPPDVEPAQQPIYLAIIDETGGVVGYDLVGYIAPTNDTPPCWQSTSTDGLQTRLWRSPNEAVRHLRDSVRAELSE